ncbi:MAG: TetR/AcrR family transcriptional regulator [Gemmatimonadota bacterium]
MFSRIFQEGRSVPTAGAAPKPSPRIREKRHRRRTEILHAALRAVREKGYHATTLDDIANHLGVQKTALYHYFPDKESILYQCHLDSLARVMTETLEASPLAFEVTALSSERQKKIITARDRYERRIRRIINEGIKSGEFRVVNSKIAVFGILGAINWIARWYRPEGRVHTPELGAEFADLLVGGLTCKPQK